MVFDVVEENERWWVRLSRAVWIGPFAEHDEALQWLQGFGFTGKQIAERRERERLRIVGGEAA
jgi:hypothetical protein